uniref:Uncharacterized protein n=1 Tax=Oryza barthii TaxID=65489 RepID=A0A0D3GWJ3_9ORYZ
MPVSRSSSASPPPLTPAGRSLARRVAGIGVYSIVITSSTIYKYRYGVYNYRDV